MINRKGRIGFGVAVWFSVFGFHFALYPLHLTLLPGLLTTGLCNTLRPTLLIGPERMLLELRVENYAVIDSVVVEFAAGLNLLTGETGAGKSILIDALALLLGEKASSDVIRHGTDKAVVAAVFELQGLKRKRQQRF